MGRRLTGPHDPRESFAAAEEMDARAAAPAHQTHTVPAWLRRTRRVGVPVANPIPARKGHARVLMAGPSSAPGAGVGRRPAGRMGHQRGLQRRACPSARRWSTQKGGSAGGIAIPAADGEALGRSRGGLTTKIHPAVDGRGRPLAVLLTAGPAGDNPQLFALLDAIRVHDGGPGRPRKKLRRPSHLPGWACGSDNEHDRRGVRRWRGAARGRDRGCGPGGRRRAAPHRPSAGRLPASARPPAWPSARPG